MIHGSREDRRPRVDTGLAASIGSNRGSRKRDRHRLKPSLQVLEGRQLMATFQVTSTADTAPADAPTAGTLRWAVQQADEATTASTIDFSLGSTSAKITLTQGELGVAGSSGSISIQGPGAGLLTINGNHLSRVFAFYGQGDASLSGVTITGGFQPPTPDGTGSVGGGVYNDVDSTLSISDCTITGNSAQAFGGGVFASGPTQLNGCTISGNSSSEGGGVYGAAARLTNCTISGNTAGYNGGGIENSSGGQVLLVNSTVIGNSAGHDGGGVYGPASLADCTISGNKAGSNGGGLCNANTTGSTYLGECTVSGNSAVDGGGLYTKSETTLTQCTISGNSAVDGGGLENGGAATIQGCTIGRNSAGDEYAGLMDFNGSAQLTDTIVAGNILPPAGLFGDNIADIGGSDAAAVTGSNNLIGTGGSGGIQGGSGGNIVLASLTGLGLAPLANYGGPTLTIALLPGSPALGSGTTISGLFADQRGEPIGSSVDIGAFQSQGFTLEPAADTTPQGTLVDDSFADPLAVTVKANNPVEPVAGGMLTYTLVTGANGASGTLSGATATIGSGGSAQVTAMAGSSVGTFTVNATSAGAAGPAQFKLSNLDGLSFSGLQDPVITYGTPSVTFSGTLSNGSMFPPPGEDVAIALDGVTHQATIGSGGTFATTFATAGLAPTGSPYTVSYTYAGDATYIDVNTISTLSVTKATPTVSVSASPGTATYGQPVTLVAKVTGSGTPTGTVTFLSGSATLGTATLDSSGQATLILSDPAPGALAVTAAYGGDADFTSGTASTTTSVSITKATPTVSLSVSPASTAFGQPITLVATVTGTGSGTPSGTVTFFDNGTVIDSGAPLNSSGQAVLNDEGLPNVGTNVITVTYSGNADFAGGG